MSPTSVPSHITLKNGEQVKINDHVYCSPTWSVRDGTPYSVARIMEFLPSSKAEDEKSVSSHGNSENIPLSHEYYTRVRLAWYYRPSDVSDRPVADARVLLAAIYSEVCEISQLRSRCYVMHRDKISDLAGWKKRPDRFYFTRLFDPYIKKEFEIIQSADVRNVPVHVRDTLISRYEYVVAEKEVVPDLTDTLRTCATCSEWCANPDTVQCDRCKNFFHMACVQPPLVAKPSRGYGWTCAPCSRRHEEEVDSRGAARHATPVQGNTVTRPPKSNAPAPRSRGRPRKDRLQAEREENMEIRCFRGWPFRYFGQYTVAEDTLDPDDLIFPRSVTRVGPRYQTNIPPPPGSTSADVSLMHHDERGGDSTIELLSSVVHMPEDQVDEVEATLQRSNAGPSVDLLTEYIRRLSYAFDNNQPFSLVNLTSIKRLEKWKMNETRVIDLEWTADEIGRFEDAIQTHGAELRAVQEEVRTRTMPEVVRFYGYWKNSRLKDENAYIRDLRKSGLDLPASKVAPPVSDDEDSVILVPEPDMFCGACSRHDSGIWWRAPKGLQSDVLCDTCGDNWRKYADLNISRPQEEMLPLPKPPKVDKEKREGTPLVGPISKRVKTNSETLSPSPLGSATQYRCMACHKSGSTKEVLKCQRCPLRLHTSVNGLSAVTNSESSTSWLCDICQNEKTLESSLNHSCLLCPRAKGSQGTGANSRQPVESFLRACKPTEGQGWVHLLCSVFIPEVTYTDTARMRLVEGISIVPKGRWLAKCGLCNEMDGAIIRCYQCPQRFHVCCAWNHGFRFGFEIHPVKSSRRDTAISTTFRGETGVMSAVVLCREHDVQQRDIYDICALDSNSGQTALQHYCTMYKQAPVEEAHALLRKAKRLDEVLSLPQPLEKSCDLDDICCYKCRTAYSPYFYKFPGMWMCHACHFRMGIPKGNWDGSEREL